MRVSCSSTEDRTLRTSVAGLRDEDRSATNRETRVRNLRIVQVIATRIFCEFGARYCHNFKVNGTEHPPSRRARIASSKGTIEL